MNLNESTIENPRAERAREEWEKERELILSRLASDIFLKTFREREVFDLRKVSLVIGRR